MVVGSQSWGTVRTPPCHKARRVECVHLCTGSGLETPVPLVVAYQALIHVHSQISRSGILRRAPFAVSKGVRQVIHLRCTERAHDRVVKTPGDVEIGNTDRDVIKKLHARPLRDEYSGWRAQGAQRERNRAKQGLKSKPLLPGFYLREGIEGFQFNPNSCEHFLSAAFTDRK